MSTIYIPVLIESAEQAEALLEGTIARSETFAPEAFVKDGDSWMGTHGPGAFTNESAVGLEALVHIEAEEEHGGWGFCTPGCERTPHSHYPRTRLVTPWEEAPPAQD